MDGVRALPKRNSAFIIHQLHLYSIFGVFKLQLLKSDIIFWIISNGMGREDFNSYLQFYQ